MNCKLCGKELKSGFPVCGECLPAGWISVKDRLPKSGVDVLLLVEVNGIPKVRVGYCTQSGQKVMYYLHYGVFGWQYLVNGVFQLVTHWMPLPAPPKEEQHE